MSEPSTAVTPQKRKRHSHVWARDQHDWYVEPSWCSERLFCEEEFVGEVWDPACGLGRITDAARRSGHVVHESDIMDRGCGYQLDFLTSGRRATNFASNPPFKIAEKFVRHALSLASGKVAMLLPTKWIQGEKRARWLEDTPLSRVWFLCPRPSMPPGLAILDGQKPGNGTADFAWFVWDKAQQQRASALVAWLHRDGQK